MKKNVYLVLMLSICLAAASGLAAQDKKTEKAQKTAAKTYINKTSVFIKNAIAQKKRSKRTDGEPYIARAFDHQKQAIKLYNAGLFEKAIYHSLKSRKYVALSLHEDKVKFDDNTEVEYVFKDFKNPRDKENKAFYKNMKKVFKNTKTAELGDAEGELVREAVEVTEDDAKVDMKQLVSVK